MEDGDPSKMAEHAGSDGKLNWWEQQGFLDKQPRIPERPELIHAVFNDAFREEDPPNPRGEWHPQIPEDGSAPDELRRALENACNDADEFVSKIVYECGYSSADWNSLIDGYPMHIDSDPREGESNVLEQKILGIYYKQISDVFVILLSGKYGHVLESLKNPSLHCGNKWIPFLQCSQELAFKMRSAKEYKDKFVKFVRDSQPPVTLEYYNRKFYNDVAEELDQEITSQDVTPPTRNDASRGRRLSRSLSRHR